jgi:hypothetical protein
VGGHEGKDRKVRKLPIIGWIVDPAHTADGDVNGEAVVCDPTGEVHIASMVAASRPSKAPTLSTIRSPLRSRACATPWRCSQLPRRGSRAHRDRDAPI